LYLQIPFKYRPNIKYKYKYMPFCDFQFNYKYTKFLYSNTITNTYFNSFFQDCADMMLFWCASDSGVGIASNLYPSTASFRMLTYLTNIIILGDRHAFQRSTVINHALQIVNYVLFHCLT